MKRCFKNKNIIRYPNIKYKSIMFRLLIGDISSFNTKRCSKCHRPFWFSVTNIRGIIYYYISNYYIH